MIKKCWLIISIFLIQSCNGFDNDEAFAYQRQAIFASWSDTTNNQIHLAELKQNNEKWKQNISSFCIQPNGIWVASQQNLTYYDLVKGEEISFSSAVTPHVMVADENFLIVADTNAQKLVFHRLGNKGSKENFEINVSQKTKGLFLKQGRVAIVGKMGTLDIYDAGSAALLFSQNYADTVKYCALDNLYNVLTSTGTEYKCNINTLTAGSALLSTWDTVATSPFRNRVYETEFTGSIGLKNNRLNLPNWNVYVDKFWPDFQNSEVFFTRNDSLFLSQLTPNTIFQNYQKPFLQLGFYWNMYEIK